MRKIVLVLTLLAFAAPALAQQSVVAAVRGKYPTPLGAQHGAFLIEVACATGKGLLRKDWGTFIRLADGTGVAQDILVEPDRSGRHLDILGDGENRAIPNWDLVTDEATGAPLLVDPARFYAPACGAPSTPHPPPSTEPAPPATVPANPPDWLEDLLATLADAEALLRTELAAIRQELAELKARPAPVYVGGVDVFGRRVTITLEPRK